MNEFFTFGFESPFTAIFLLLFAVLLTYGRKPLLRMLGKPADPPHPQDCGCEPCRDRYINARRAEFEAVRRKQQHEIFLAETEKHLEEEYGVSLKKKSEQLSKRSTCCSVCGLVHNYGNGEESCVPALRREYEAEIAFHTHRGVDSRRSIYSDGRW